MKSLKILVYFILSMLGWQKGICQDLDEFKRLDKSEYLIFILVIHTNQCEVIFEQIPENLAGSRLLLYNQTRNKSHWLEIPYKLKTQIAFEMGNSWLNRDTFLISIHHWRNGALDYHPHRVIVYEGRNLVNLGENCYLLECIPHNDPWMPYISQPYLFSITDYYLNPKTGRIQTGKKIVNSMLYNACELTDFIWINPHQKYGNLKRETWSGEQLIRKKKIKIKEWDIESLKRRYN